MNVLQKGKPFSGASIPLPPMSISPEEGYAYVCPIPTELVGDSEGASVSRLVLFENDRPLLDAHSMHADIRTSGEGKYSHWGNNLYFSATDNSNPQTNGKKYSYAWISPIEVSLRIRFAEPEVRQ